MGMKPCLARFKTASFREMYRLRNDLSFKDKGCNNALDVDAVCFPLKKRNKTSRIWYFNFLKKKKIRNVSFMQLLVST